MAEWAGGGTQHAMPGIGTRRSGDLSSAAACAAPFPRACVCVSGRRPAARAITISTMPHNRSLLRTVARVARLPGLIFRRVPHGSTCHRCDDTSCDAYVKNSRQIHTRRECRGQLRRDRREVSSNGTAPRRSHAARNSVVHKHSRVFRNFRFCILAQGTLPRIFATAAMPLAGVSSRDASAAPTGRAARCWAVCRVVTPITH